MRRQLVPGPVVRLTVIKAKTRPGIEASCEADTAPDRLQGMFLFMCQVSFCIALSVFASRRAKSSGFSCSLNFHALL